MKKSPKPPQIRSSQTIKLKQSNMTFGFGSTNMDVTAIKEEAKEENKSSDSDYLEESEDLEDSVSSRDNSDSNSMSHMNTGSFKPTNISNDQPTTRSDQATPDLQSPLAIAP